MAKIISVFNNKGGVGKTTYLYHIAHLMARSGKRVLLVDCDSQCNLTAYTMHDRDIERAWDDKGNSIYRVIELVHQGKGDFRPRGPSTPKPKEYPNLHMVPGDLLLSNFEDKLGDTWNRSRGGEESGLHVQSAIYRYIRWAGEKVNADVIFVDLGPNMGALNRAVLGSSDLFIVPVAPDLFSIKGTENLGTKLVSWRREWDQCCAAATDDSTDLPKGRPAFLGYVIQHHTARQNGLGMTQGWAIFGEQVPAAIESNIVNHLRPLGQAIAWPDGNYDLGRIPNLNSLIPYSLEARKPIFDCSSADGLRGEHITRARDSAELFSTMVRRIDEVLTLDAMPAMAT